MILNVCKRLGKATNTNPWVYRFGFIFTSFIGAIGVVTYCVFAVVMNMTETRL